MRLRLLNLPRYGLFTDQEIDFGPAPTGSAPDLHVIYGPNEAGKSTLLAGFLDLLFGIGQRSDYGFLHGYDAMRVEADLEIDGEALRFVRTKKRRGSLRDGNDRPIAEGVLASGLSGIDRETYKAMFSLDDDTLEAGGEEILNSKGDLGQILFESSAGLVELSEALKRLRNGTESFHKGQTKNTILYELKSQLNALADRKRDIDMAADVYARLVTERNRTQTEYDDATAEVARLETIKANAERRLRALPLLADIRRLREEFRELSFLPEAPETWFKSIGRLMEKTPSLTTRVEVLDQERQDRAEKLEKLTVDDAVLAIEDRITRLNSARYETAENDLPRRRVDLVVLEKEIAATLRRLEKPPGTAPASLVVPAAVVGTLHELVECRSGIEERLKAAEDELDAAKVESESAAEALRTIISLTDGNEMAFDRLDDVLKDAQGRDHGGRYEAHAQRHRHLKVELDCKAAQLHPWNDEAKGLVRVHVPQRDELAAWREGLGAVEQEIERLESKKTELAAERQRLSGSAQARKTETGVVDDDEAANLRALRDQAWQHHRSVLDSASADSFEKRMNAYDAAADGRLSQALSLTDIRRDVEGLRNTEAAIHRNAQEIADAQARRQTVLDEVTDAVATMVRTGAADLPPSITLLALSGWIDRRADILKTLEDIAREEGEMKDALAEENRHRETLAKSLATAGVAYDPASPLTKLEKVARVAISDERDRRAKEDAARKRSEQAQASLERRRDEIHQARRDDEKWRRALTDALSRCWLRDSDPAPSSSELRHILEAARTLEEAHRNHAAMTDRIKAMERDQVAYVAEVEAIAEAVGETFDDVRPFEQGKALKSSLARVVADRKTRDGLQQEIDEGDKKIAEAKRELAELRAEAEEMLKAFKVDSLSAVNERLQKVERRAKIRDELSEREKDLIETMNANSLQEAEGALDDADQDALDEEVAKTKTRLEDTSNRKQGCYHTWRQAEDALTATGSDDNAARLEQERRTILLQIEDGARDYLRIRLGIEAAERALAAYRDEHRSSMMERASAAFQIISRGTYSKLVSEPSDKGDLLMAIPADGGGAKIASDMSKGARFQLYLALRVAGYREFADRHEPIPFVADDILETFDDFRAEEAFRLFAEMAGFGQVIYLSHHRHLCRIAQEVCPTVKVHELPGVGASN